MGMITKAFLIGGAILCIGATVRAAGPLKVWAVDPHVKVFGDLKAPAAAGTLKLRAIRNELECAQLAVRAAAAAKGVRVEVSPLRCERAGAAIAAEHVTWNFVGFIPLKQNTRGAERVRLRPAPCRVPDPLLADRSMDVPAGATQPVWLTVRVPKDAAAGVYRGQVTVRGGKAAATLPVELTVDDVTLGDERHLLVTNWFHVSRIAKAHKLQLWREPFWRMLELYARNLADHRQNVVYTPWSLIDVTRGADGKLAFDYARFDRFVEVFERAGAADRIELTHVGHFGKGGWRGREIVLRSVSATDAKTGKSVRLPPAEGLAALLSDLERHLAAKGWLKKAMIHVADEPSLHNIDSWRKASAFVRAAAPRLRRIDAIEAVDFSGALEVWVPKLSHFDRWRAAYERHRKGNELWYYICCHPFGNVYPNRFLDYPLSRVRVLHWINFAADLPGYLHWGLAAWGDDPFAAPPDRLPPGDTHVIYPGPDGPLNSIRWEIQRESIEDYEKLCALAARTAAVKKRLGPAAAAIDPRRRALEICRRVVPSIAHVETDPRRIVAAARAVVDEIAQLDREPLLLVQTNPPDGAELIYGPIAIEVHGVVQPGTAVTINGNKVEPRPDGSFAQTVGLGSKAAEIRVEAEREGKKKLAVRRFRVRK